VLFISVCCDLAASPPLRVLSPSTGETRHDNRGKLRVEVIASVPYSALRVLIDDQPYGGPYGTTTFTLTGIDRGEHTIEVQALDSSGLVLAASRPVTFYMWHASKLFPNRAK
jgi:hypothetical protein